MDTKLEKDAIESVMSALIAHGAKEAEELAFRVGESANLNDLKTAIEKYNFEECYFSLPYSFSKLLRGVIADVVTQKNRRGEWTNIDRSRFEFLLLHQDFVESNFVQFIEKIEGSACSVDKSRTIMRRLLKFFATGEQIGFDYGGEYTYHLPTKVFAAHDEILVFFEALYALYYGRPDTYFAVVVGLMEQVKVAEQHAQHWDTFTTACITALTKRLGIEWKVAVKTINGQQEAYAILREGFNAGEAMESITSKLVQFFNVSESEVTDTQRQLLLQFRPCHLPFEPSAPGKDSADKVTIELSRSIGQD